MNIVDFLIENYHWILAIILLTIITIIGFLADKKKNDKKKDDTKTKIGKENENTTINQQPLQYQPEIQNQVNSSQNMMPNNMNSSTDGQINNELINKMNNNQNQGTIPQIMTPIGMEQNNNNLINNPQPVENIIPKEIQEPMYQSLDEQKNPYTLQPIPNFETMKDMHSPSPQIINNQIPLGNQNMMNPQPMMQQTMSQPINMQQPIQNIESIGQMYNSNYNQNTNTQENNTQDILNVIPNQGTIPQPVIPQPIMSNQTMNIEPMGQMSTYNMNQQIPNQNGLIGNQIQQQPIMQPTPSQPINMQQQMQTPISPINFVYGPQNNNQNM